MPFQTMCMNVVHTKQRQRVEHTFAVDLALLCGALALVKILVAHLRGHRDAFSGGLGDVLGHPKPPRDYVPKERHPTCQPQPSVIRPVLIRCKPSAQDAASFLFRNQFFDGCLSVRQPVGV